MFKAGKFLNVSKNVMFLTFSPRDPAQRRVRKNGF